MANETYAALNQKWKSTTQIIFKNDVGELADFKEWLRENTRPLVRKKSGKSGKDVSLVLSYYSGKAKFLSFDEVDYSRKFAPLSINDIKDLDSIRRAVSERVEYVGNIALGNTGFVEDSADVVDSYYVLSSAQIMGCKYIAYSYNMEYCESVFGVQNAGYSKYCIRNCQGKKIVRSFELHHSPYSSDCYYSHGIYGSKNCMFCFNLRNAEFRIGNIKLTQEEYAKWSSKLVSEMAEELKSEKKLPSLVELVCGEPQDFSDLISPSQSSSPVDRKAIENCFSNSTKALFGKSLKDAERYEKWLKGVARETKVCKSALDGSAVLIADSGRAFDWPENRLVNGAQAVFLGERLSFGSEVPKDLSFRTIPKYLGKIAYFTQEYDVGRCANIIESQINVESANCFRSVLNLESKNCLYDYYVLLSDSAIGCNSVRNSAFVLRCSLSTKLTRCFEVDSSNNCSDVYFAHNCENVHDSMFCFSARNKWNAIGNAELGKEKYAQLKGKLLADLADEIEMNRGLSWSIFTID